MSKKLRIVFKSIGLGVSALYLGYVVANVFLGAFLPGSFEGADTLFCAVGFFLALRWLTQKNGTTTTIPSTAAKRFSLKPDFLARNRSYVFGFRNSEIVSCGKSRKMQVGYDV